MAKAKIKVVSAEKAFSANAKQLIQRVAVVLQRDYGLSVSIEFTESTTVKPSIKQRKLRIV